MEYIKRTMILIFLLILAVCLMVLFKTTPIYADISDYLNATIRISICGNEIIEGGEDCEGENLNGQTCENLGFGPGTLSCDIACSYDTYNCSSASTSTPTPTPTTTASTSEATPNSSQAITTQETVAPIIFQAPIAELVLPSFLLPFDPNKDGKIVIDEVYAVAKSWVEQWRQALLGDTALEINCDLNRDNKCDLKDFSILMSYVEQ